MKVVALISGGKDSCYNMMLCQDHGHEIVALANLLPEDDSTEELDSFMYQTVGHQLIAAYATCMGLPLFRRRIRGKSMAQGLQYSATKGDEVEDLQALLAAVKHAIPDVQAVSSGAIASDYQRLRVENVCSRLGLVSLAFLWRREQSGLLSDMVAAGVRAVLIKVAAMGLDPHKHLGRELGAMRPTLERLKSLYGCNVCGEGGEYETLTLDCPLFKYARIVLDETAVVIHSADAFAPVGILHAKKFHLEPKQIAALPTAELLHASQNGGPVDPDVRLGAGRAAVIMVEDRASPSEKHTEDKEATVANGGGDTETRLAELRIGTSGQHQNGGDERFPRDSEIDIEVGNADSDGIFRIRCCHRPSETEVGGLENASNPSSQWDSAKSEAGTTTARNDASVRAVERSRGSEPRPGEVITPEVSGNAVRSLLTSAEAELAARGMAWADVIYVYLFLAEMAHFAQVNAAYKAVITEEKCASGGGVPSRSTVQVDLPPGCAAKVEVLVAERGLDGKGGLGPKAAGSSQMEESDSGGFEGRGLAGGEASGLVFEDEHGSEGNSNSDRESAVAREAESLQSATLGRNEPQADRWDAEARAAEGMAEWPEAAVPRKKVLHVQSISAWAPSCIGPYSQATAYRGRLYMAGMLGLDPPSMELVAGGAGTQMARALLSCEAVAEAMGTSARLNGDTFTVFYDRKCSEANLRAVKEELGLFLDGRPSAQYTDSFNRTFASQDIEGASEEESPPILQRRDLREEVAQEMRLESEDDAGSGKDVVIAPADESCSQSEHRPHVKYESVPALPKGALVEVVMLCRL